MTPDGQSRPKMGCTRKNGLISAISSKSTQKMQKKGARKRCCRSAHLCCQFTLQIAANPDVLFMELLVRLSDRTADRATPESTVH